MGKRESRIKLRHFLLSIRGAIRKFITDGEGTTRQKKNIQGVKGDRRRRDNFKGKAAAKFGGAK